MEMITGRLTADAIVKTISEDKQVVNFSIAVNDRYKSKSGESKENTRYFRCAYWNRSAIAPYLKKGGLIELAGRIEMQVWNDKDGSAKGTLTMQVNNLKFLSGARGEAAKADEPAAQTEVVKEDLPF